MNTRHGSALRIIRCEEGADVVLVLRGELEASTLPALRTDVAEAFATGSPATGGRLVLDVSALSFLDSAGLGEIVRLHRALHALGSRLVLRSPSEVVRTLLAVTALTGHLEID